MVPEIRKETKRTNNKEKGWMMEVECDICNDTMKVSKQRYVELVKAGLKPRCSKNGCLGMFPYERPIESIATIKQSPYKVVWPRKKKGNRNGSLPKLKLVLNREELIAPLPDEPEDEPEE